MNTIPAALLERTIRRGRGFPIVRVSDVQTRSVVVPVAPQLQLWCDRRLGGRPWDTRVIDRPRWMGTGVRPRRRSRHCRRHWNDDHNRNRHSRSKLRFRPAYSTRCAGRCNSQESLQSRKILGARAGKRSSIDMIVVPRIRNVDCLRHSMPTLEPLTYRGWRRGKLFPIARRSVKLRSNCRRGR